jgi:hypothetical protein
MSRGRKKRKDPEYRLLISPHLDERHQRPTTLVILETTRSFSNFRYELSMEVTRDKRSLWFKVLGLHAPHNNLPGAGPARFRREFDNLTGNYDVTIEGLNGKITTCSVRIAENQVEFLKIPRDASVLVVTEVATRHSSNERQTS